MSKDFAAIHQGVVSGMGDIGGDAKGVMAGFFQMHKSATAEGEVPTRYKELMALAIAIAVRCEGCIACHVHDALEAGATRGEVVEAIGVAVMMGGGPAVVYGIEAREALDQFQAAKAAALS